MLDKNQPTSETNQKPQLPLYDADKEQRIPFLIEHGGRSYEVIFLLRGQSDEALEAYDRLCKLGYQSADRKETDGENAIETKSQAHAAAIALFADRAFGVEGIGAEGETLPDDWQERIDELDRAGVIDSAYLTTLVQKPKAAAKGDALPWDYRSTNKAYTLVALYSGYELELKHELKTASAEQLAEFKSIMTQRYLMQGTKLNNSETRIPPRARRLGKLYDKLVAGTEGYEGRVPLHHKVEVVLTHLNPALEALRKN